MADQGKGASQAAWVPLAEKAQADAATRTGVPASQWKVKEAQHVTWRDGSLGVTEPGYMYTMALVPGFRIVLEHNGTELRYHTSMSHVKFAGDGVDNAPRWLEPRDGGAADLGL